MIDYKQKLIKGDVRRPNRFTTFLFRLWTGKVCRQNHVKFTYEYDRKQMKNKQVILLCTHSARNEFFYDMHGFGRRDIHIVAGMQNFLKNRSNYKAMISMGVIPKFLYQPDISCTKKMLSVIRRGGSLALWPEGIQSISGSTHPINPATCKFLKKAGLTIVLCKTQGAYLTTNRYSTDHKKGNVYVNYKILFTPEQLKELTEEQIYRQLIEQFRYNEFETNRNNKIEYKGKKPNITGATNIIYRCPHCNSPHTLSINNDTMTCSSCGYAVTMDNCYQLHTNCKKLYFQDVDQWFKWQRRVVHNLTKDQNFCLQASGKLLTLRTDKWKKPPHNTICIMQGNVTLTHKGLTISNENGETKHFSVENVYSLTLVVGKYLEFYYNDEYYRLEIDCPTTHLVEWMLTSEELHNHSDEKWFAASNDVYDYDEKGGAQ